MDQLSSNMKLWINKLFRENIDDENGHTVDKITKTKVPKAVICFTKQKRVEIKRYNHFCGPIKPKP